MCTECSKRIHTFVCLIVTSVLLIYIITSVQLHHSTSIAPDKRGLVTGKNHSGPNFTRTISCKALFNHDKSELAKAYQWMKNHPKHKLSAKHYINVTTNCATFKFERYSYKTTEFERNFPLAYVISVYKDIEQVERLLHAIYRPQNYYCLHFDTKSSDDLKNGINAIVSCFNNVLRSSSSIKVTWGQYSVLHQNLICMEDLWKYKDWKYLINLTGQEFPLKTNLEIVSILKTLKGANVVDGSTLRGFSDRWSKAGAPPHNLTMVKGEVHIAVNRHFVDFALHSPVSKDFLKYVKKTFIPDETFFNTLNHNPHLGIPGSFTGDPEQYPQKVFFLRYKNWRHEAHSVWSRPCGGKINRDLCVLGVGDLHRLKNDINLFANKFFLDYEYLALDCMEELIMNRIQEQEKENYRPDVSFYDAMDYNKLMIPVPDQEFYL